MNIERKTKLTNYLFKDEKMKDFLFEDFFEELGFIIKPSDCISKTNNSNLVRTKHLKKVKNQTNRFLTNNKFYMNVICDFYKHNNIDQIVYDLVVGYVFYLTETKERFNNIDIFMDTKSICYSPVSVIDLI